MTRLSSKPFDPVIALQVVATISKKQPNSKRI